MKEIVENVKNEIGQNGNNQVDRALISQIVADLKTPKYLLYSGHDSTMAPLWDFLNATNFHWSFIPFASSLHIELIID